MAVLEGTDKPLTVVRPPVVVANPAAAALAAAQRARVAASLANANAIAAAKKKRDAEVAAQIERERVSRAMWAGISARAALARSQLTSKPVTQVPSLLVGKRESDADDALYVSNRAKIAADIALAAEVGFRKQRDLNLLTWSSTKGNSGSYKSLRILQRLLREADARHKADPLSLDIDYIAKTHEAYNKALAAFNSSYIQQVNKLNSFFVQDGVYKKGKNKGQPIYKWKNADAIRQHGLLLRSPEFRLAKRQWEAVHGGSDAAPGTHYNTELLFQGMGDRQRQYMYDVARTGVYKNINSMRQAGDKEEAAALQSSWEKTGKWQYQAAVAEIDPQTTSLPDERTFRGAYSGDRLTPQQELDKRQEIFHQNLIQQGFLYNKALANFRVESRQEQRFQSLPEQQELRRERVLLAEASMALALGDKGPTSKEEVGQVVQTALRTWDYKNRRLWLSSRIEGMLNGNSPFARAAALNSSEYKNYLAEREKVEKRYWDTFHAEKPGVLDTIVNTDIIKQTLQASQFGFGGILGIARVGVASFGILSQDPNATSKLFGVEPAMGDAPAGFQRVLAESDARIAAAQAASGVRPDENTAARNELARVSARNALWKAYIQSPEGKAWYDAKYVSNKAESSAEDQAFLRDAISGAGSGSVTGSGDFFSRIGAFGAYGGAATRDPLANFALTVATDPLNAVPLKFTTWKARLNYANDVASGQNRLVTAWDAAKKFTTVNEATLRYQAGAKPYLAMRAAGLSDEAIRETIFFDSSSIVNETLRAKHTRDLFRALGIDRVIPSGRSLLGLSQTASAAEVRAAGRIYVTPARQAARDKLAREAAEAASLAAAPGPTATSIRAAASGRVAAAAKGALSVARRTANKVTFESEQLDAVRGTAGAPTRSVGTRLLQALPGRMHPFFAKDVAKFQDSNKFIGQGIGSTGDYNRALGGSDNVFSRSDIIAVSANGTRRGVVRAAVVDAAGNLTPEYRAIDRGIRNKAQFVTDIPADRARPFNVGEREVATYLTNKGYVEFKPGRWAHPDDPSIAAPGLVAQADALEGPARVAHLASVPDRVAVGKSMSPASRLRAIAAFPSTMIAAPARTLRGARVTRGGAEYRYLENARVQQRIGRVAPAAPRTATYIAKQVEIDAVVNRVIPAATLKAAGIDVSSRIPGGVTVEQILRSGVDLIEASTKRETSTFIQKLARSIENELRIATGDATYTIRQWLDDVRTPHDAKSFVANFDRIEALISREVRRPHVRGVARNILADIKRSPGPKAPSATVRTELLETDMNVILAKARVLKSEGLTLAEYNEIRKVLRKPLVQERINRRAVSTATRKAVAEMRALGIRTTDKGYAKAFEESRRKFYRAHINALAAKEAEKHLEEIAQTMVGSSEEEIIRAFEKLYNPSGNVTGFQAPTISAFQKEVLEEASRRHLGVSDLANQESIAKAWSDVGQAPPFHNQALMREWLVEQGYWTVRTANAIRDGNKSWSIEQEGEYFRQQFGVVPIWADKSAYQGAINSVLHSENLLADFNREIGTFNRNMTARFLTNNMSQAERIKFLVEGDITLKVNAIRDIVAERKYAAERYGDLVLDAQNRFIAMPWLMNLDELRVYVGTRTAKNIMDGLPKTIERVDELERMIAKRVTAFYDKAIKAGGDVSFEDIFSLSVLVVEDLVKHPSWLRRWRDHLGAGIRAQASIRRMFVFSQIPFATTNAIDSQVKAGYMSIMTRSFRTGRMPSAVARSYNNAADWGQDSLGQLLRQTPIHGTHRIAASLTGSNFEETALGKIGNAALGTLELPAQVGGLVETATKIRLAQGMYDGVYAKALKDGLEPGAADAFARKFSGEEAWRLWPTVGGGPIESLLNNLSPFLSYQYKNHVLFLSELAAHPAMFNYFNNLGNLIQAYNQENYEKTHPGMTLDPKFARRIQLPWAPDVYIDLGAFSDAQRGIAPLYKALETKQTVRDVSAQFLRLAGASDINVIGGVLNYFKFPMRYEWRQGHDEDGFGDGVWTKEAVPWEAPWGGTANAVNSLWPIQLWENFQKVLKSTSFAHYPSGGVDFKHSRFNEVDVTRFVYQGLFFGRLLEYDHGQALVNYHRALKLADPEAAKTWLETQDGKNMIVYLREKAISAGTREFGVPKDILDIINPDDHVDPSPWFHGQTKAYQTAVKNHLTELREIRERWSVIIDRTEPRSEERKEAFRRMETEKYEYYAAHPIMYEYEVFHQTPDQWAKTLNEWHVDDLVQNYYDMEAPDVKAYGDDKNRYNRDRATWLSQRELFLRSFPAVAERLAKTRDEVEAIWRQTEEHWFNDILENIGRRKIAIQAAKAAENFPLLDQLYVMQEFSYAQLSQDVSIQFFDDVDLETVKNSAGEFRPQLKSGLLPRTKILPDFNAWRFARMSVKEKAEYEREQKYQKAFRAVVDKAKKSKDFGSAFAEGLQAQPWLMNEWFDRNKGKREKWAAGQAYFKAISRFGSLMRQGKFKEADAYFATLSDEHKARYYQKHPDKKAAVIANLRYIGYMKKWTEFYRHRDYAGGAAFFAKMPQDVRDRYYKGNPEGFSGKPSPYSKAMGTWVGLLEDGKKVEAKKYFDSMPQAFKDRYYKKHPDQLLQTDIRRTGQLSQYFSADDMNRAAYLENNPEFAKWLKAQGTKDSTRRMLVMAGYMALGKDEQWLKRVYREKYPEYFSAESKGVSALRGVNAFLIEHPEMKPAFQRWVDAVMETYREQLKHTKNPPRPLVSDHSRQRGSGSGKSAAWVRLHSA